MKDDGDLQHAVINHELDQESDDDNEEMECTDSGPSPSHVLVALDIVRRFNENPGGEREASVKLHLTKRRGLWRRRLRAKNKADNLGCVHPMNVRRTKMSLILPR